MIVTIGREHGSNGHDIARALAEALQYRCYDKEIVDKAAESSNFSKEVLQSYDEKRVAPYIATSPHFVGLNEGFRLNMQLAAAQFQAIRELAETIAAIGVKKVIIEIPNTEEKKGFNVVTKSVFSTRKLENLGWKPICHIKEGLIKTINEISGR